MRIVKALMSRRRIALTALTLAAAAGIPSLALALPIAERAQAAILAVVVEKVGPRAQVQIDELRVAGDIEGAVRAIPAPGSRVGGRIRFILRPANGDPRSANADAIVSVSIPHLKATRPLRRGEPIDPSAVVEEVGEMSGMLLQPLPGLAGIAGATVVRDVAAGEVLTASMVAPAIIVKAGDKILAMAKVAGLEVQGNLVAAQAAHLGDVIRCVNPETRRAMAVRIVGRGVGEIVHAF